MIRRAEGECSIGFRAILFRQGRRCRAWEVVDEPHIGTLYPDLIATDPDGRLYVFEVKTERAQAHLGAVAQVETYRDNGKEVGEYRLAHLLNTC